jgi:hypothetical protein
MKVQTVYYESRESRQGSSSCPDEDLKSRREHGLMRYLSL